MTLTATDIKGMADLMAEDRAVVAALVIAAHHDGSISTHHVGPQWMQAGLVRAAGLAVDTALLQLMGTMQAHLEEDPR